MFELVVNAHLLGKLDCTQAGLFIQCKGFSDPEWVKNIIKDIEIIEQFKILKNKANVGNSKIPSRRIAESVDLVFSDAYRAFFCCEDT